MVAVLGARRAFFSNPRRMRRQQIIARTDRIFGNVKGQTGLAHDGAMPWSIGKKVCSINEAIIE